MTRLKYNCTAQLNCVQTIIKLDQASFKQHNTCIPHSLKTAILNGNELVRVGLLDIMMLYVSVIDHARKLKFSSYKQNVPIL